MSYSKDRPFIKVDVTGVVDKKFDDLTAQMAQKANENEVRLKSVKLDPEDLSEDTLALVTGEGVVDLKTIPQEDSVGLAELKQETIDLFSNDLILSYSAYVLDDGEIIAEKSGNDVFIKFSSNRGVRLVYLNGFEDYSIEDILTEVEREPEEGPSGSSGFLRINNQETLVFNIETKKFEIANFRRFDGSTHVRLMTVYYGTIVEGLFFNIRSTQKIEDVDRAVDAISDSIQGLLDVVTTEDEEWVV